MTDYTKLEERAIEALDLPAFPLNLREIRDNVKNLLKDAQRYGFFDEYTSHSFDHVTGMLKTAEWIIPKATLQTLSPGDCLFITLAIYFHDVGLLISRKEYEKRNKNPEFKKYLSDLENGSESNIEYLVKINKLDDERREKTLYQEFVRLTHGSRVRAWIEGAQLDDDEASAEIRKAIQVLIGKLDSVARRDLALICESHTLDDISDTSKYKLSRPYGGSREEEVNLQYAAVILRSVDLLQITQLRAPSILYKIISPTDPTSQIEWQKQGAVKSVRAAPGVDREGNVTQDVLPNTIEVHARFEKSDGFFGLTSYLSYAETQLNACYEAIKKSEKNLINPPLFPWKFIDDTFVEADGFLTEAFGFELDQQKILDLLTGHTLYNDTDVVIRELTQNALDAVRLQSSIDCTDSSADGHIKIVWNSKERTLEIIDNGTGMSQAVIENHLLTVGSSRYQDPKFREKHPDFSSISRFGIGVLSAFMVADSVQITTCSPDDEMARQISLRSVHGKYLIKLLNKISERPEIGVWPHGSSVKLTLRSTAEIGDVLAVAQNWLLFPRCNVEVKIDNEAPIKVGFNTPKDALEYYITRPDFLSTRGKTDYSVRQVQDGGVTLAYVVESDDLFKDWTFVQLGDRRSFLTEEEKKPYVATCIEGVGVEFNTPGFRSSTILSIANIVGKGAPKTNVARTMLEDTSEYREALKKIYKLYCKHIIDEIERLSKSEEYSLSRAIEQAPYIAHPLISPQAEIVRHQLLNDELDKVPFILLEENKKRHSISIEKLKTLQTYWTINSPLTSSVEFFVREAPRDISASIILENLQDESSSLPEGITMCNFGNSKYIEKTIRAHFQPSAVEADERNRRLTINWKKIDGTPLWISSTDLNIQLFNTDRRLWAALRDQGEYQRPGRDVREVLFAVDEITTKNLNEYSEFSSNRQIYLTPGDPISNFLKKIWSSGHPDHHRATCGYLAIIEALRLNGWLGRNMSVDTINKVINTNGLTDFLKFLDISALVAEIRQSRGKRFDPFAWKRRSDLEQ